MTGSVRIHRPHVIPDSLRIYFSAMESGFKTHDPDLLSNSPDACERKPYPDKKNTSYGVLIMTSCTLL